MRSRSMATGPVGGSFTVHRDSGAVAGFIMTLTQGARWVRFLRQYGPIPRNDNMYDEHIRRCVAGPG